eukprot:Skav216776  [mRNA]  locus=scaffold579:20106:28607:+ [translate_table: standard]
MITAPTSPASAAEEVDAEEEVDSGSFDFSQVSFAQPVADDEFEDAFYESTVPTRAAEEEPSAERVDDGANRTSPIPERSSQQPQLDGTGGREAVHDACRRVMVVSHAPRSILYAAATAAMNAMFCAERGLAAWEVLERYSDDDTQIMLTREVSNFVATWHHVVGSNVSTEWTISLIDRVRRECLADQKQDEDTLKRLLYDEVYEDTGSVQASARTE